ncbi:class I SAM-dependent methyltransferase [Patulibacter sp. NPDC049589]|uniref:class I SAM-dependent methyltransferase n=1 Tax=Patulibacter sp. NPDC049589 TaxID=3154731 RepID=UPI00343A937E
MSLERLSTEAINETSLESLEHRHRYEAVRTFCRDRRVLDLCCGVGYGSALLQDVAASVHGVDIAPEAIDEGQRTYGHLDGLTLAVGDAIETLGDETLMADVDVVVCFEGVEHIIEKDALLDALVRVAGTGTTVIFSVPNSRRYEEDNAFHLANFDRDAVDRWAARFATPAVVWEQWHAQGSLIGPEPGAGTNAPSLLAPVPSDARPSGWATHYMVLVNAVEAADQDTTASMAWAVEPVNARWLEGLRRANRELWRSNARLADTDAHPRGTYSAAAASVIDRWKTRALAAEKQARAWQNGAENYEDIRNRQAVKMALGTAKRVRSVRDRLGR